MRNIVLMIIVLASPTVSHARVLDIANIYNLGPDTDINAKKIYDVLVYSTENDTINCNNLVVTTDFILVGLPDNTIKSRLNIMDTEFRGEFRVNAVFEGITQIRDCVFRGNTDFSNSTFNNLTDFSYNLFIGKVSFHNASFIFDDITTFMYCVFHGEVDLRIKEATRMIDFTAATCDTIVTVSGVFGEGLYFGSSILKNTLVFENITQSNKEPSYAQSFDLNNSTFNDIQLRNSSINEFKFFRLLTS